MKAAFLLALNDAIYLNDYDRDIEYNGQTYKADRSLAQIAEIKDGAILPKLGIQVICKRKDLYQLLQTDPGPIPCEMFFVEYDEAAQAWAVRWQFSGILGEGQMEYYLYSGVIEHRLAWLLRNPRRIFWNRQTQQTRAPGTPEHDPSHPLYKSPDMAMDYVHEIQERRQRLNWRGYRE